jgi:hypothetical protein
MCEAGGNASGNSAGLTIEELQDLGKLFFLSRESAHYHKPREPGKCFCDHTRVASDGPNLTAPRAP